MKNKLLLTISVIVFCLSAQGQFTNDWIDANQRYFRIPVIEDGLHTISQSQLAGAGIPLSTAPNRFQIFRKGQELAIRVVSQDNIVQRIEFYGKKNDGSGDEELYRTPETQPHQYYNLYSDTAAYFLTWKVTTGSGKRMDSDGSLTPATVEPFFLEEILVVESDSYSLGDRYGSQNSLSSGLYDEGEGFTGTSRGKNGKITYTLNIEDQNESTSAKPTLELLLQGRNNLDHRAEVSVGPTGTSLRVLDTLENFSSFETYLFQETLEWSDFAAGQIVVQITVLGYPSTADNISVSYLKLDYPRNFSIGANANKHFSLQPSAEPRLYVRLPTTNSATRIFDITDEYNPLIRQTSTTIESGAIYFSINDDPSVSRKILAVTNPIAVVGLKEAITTKLNPAQANYLIISHDKLRAAASDGLDPVQAYADYREADFDVHIADINDLFDQFNYGDPSPLAIKNYLKYASSIAERDYLFLIGKGLDLTFVPYRVLNYSTGEVKPHFIPSFGVPGSDALFSVGLSDPMLPAIPTGRLNAQNSEDIKNYLDKVKAMESLPYDALWRKKLLQLSGGQTAAELSLFSSYIGTFKSVAESEYLGGSATNRGKSSTDVVETINVNDVVEAGLNLVTFFGHSTSSTTDISIGQIDNYNNFPDRYPFLLVNGCQGGSIFQTRRSFGENWLMNHSQRGAIGVIAHSDLAFSSGLRRFSNLFYDNQFGSNETFGLPIGDVMELVQTEYFNQFGTDDLSLSQVYGMLLQGDPAYKLFGATNPDYAITDLGVSASAIGTDRIVSTSTSFSLDLVVSNFGMVDDDSLLIKVDRTLSDGELLSYTRKFPRVLYQDTISFVIENDISKRNDGQNNFVITLDPDDAVQELSEINNVVLFELFLAIGNTINLYPTEYDVVDKQNVKFLWQSADLLSDERSYSFEVDTVQTFNSAFKQSRDLSGQLLLSQLLDLSGLPDSTTVFWRTRFTESQENEDTTWVVSSFSVFTTTNEGWGQFSDDQIRENSITGVSYNEVDKRWQFLTTTTPIQVNNHGLENPNGFTYSDFKVVINNVDLLLNTSIEDRFCITNTMNAIVFNKESAQPTRPFGFTGDDLTNPLVCGRQPQVIYNFTSSQILGTRRYLDSLIQEMDEDDALLLFSFDSVGYSAWDDQLKQSLNLVGISTSTINALEDGQPAIFLGKKGMAQGEAVALVDNGGGLPPEEQTLQLNEDVVGVYTSAQIKTQKIGPARVWGQFDTETENDINDPVYYRINGVDGAGNETNLFDDEVNEPLDLSSIDAAQYPYLTIDYQVYDDGNQRPSKLKFWKLEYEKPAEGILVALDKEVEEIQEGADFEKEFSFINVSDKDFIDSLEVELSFFNLASSEVVTRYQTVEAPLSGDSVKIVSSFSTLTKVGINNLSVKVQPSETELYETNNVVNLAGIAEVTEDETNPVLDVTFDGLYILDGDIVSPTPRIVVKFKDDNPYLFKDDTSGIELAIKYPCETCTYERVNMTSSAVSYSTASSENDFEITFNPGPLEDGVYQFRAQGQDESGNASGLEPYEISFEVINESTITHFYPYPNPFSTSTRFVFTLTGGEVPEEIKIQIMTVSGRVVREINQDEIGSLKIGNNITETGWDGKDEFGDQLANGVYLYKVFVRQNGENMKHRTTSADRAFKNGFGKIYLLK